MWQAAKRARRTSAPNLGRDANMKHARLFLAPHLDDGAISFGGTLLAENAAGGEAARTTVATVFSRSTFTAQGVGDVDVVSAVRQSEERTVMSSVGAEVLFLDFLECLLRGYTISDVLDYPKRIDPALDAGLVETMAARLDELFAEFDEVLVPLAVGDRGHADHRVVRLAAAAAWSKHPDLGLRLYEDAFYISPADRARISSLPGCRLKETSIDLDAKLKLIQGYESQPIESWVALIRETAGDPPVERTWRVRDPGCLAAVEEV